MADDGKALTGIHRLQDALGRIPADSFPFPLDRRVVARKLEQLRRRMHRLGFHPSSRSLAEGFLRIACHHVAQAIRSS